MDSKEEQNLNILFVSPYNSCLNIAKRHDVGYTGILFV